ncbi:hypothetical protein ACFL6S_27230 [Candidatus Poribacteria bacterium]
MKWPEQKKFAFTVVDDTDKATVENVKPVYDLLAESGIKTTKTVWPIAPEREGRFGGMTCQDEEYLEWLYTIRDAGFEIAFHGAADQTSRREDTGRAIDAFHKFFGADQFLYCAHADQGESIYWGEYRIGGMRRKIYQLATRLKRRNQFRGHLEGDPLFWGDLCRKHVSYVRNFTYREINTLGICSEMPYHDPSRPYVNYWFASSDGPNVRSFCDLISEENQDLLEKSGGACIAYTHFANDFLIDGKLDPEFVRLIKALSSRDGWFVPASTMLEHLRSQAGWRSDIDPKRLRRLEWKWLLGKLAHGTS